MTRLQKMISWVVLMSAAWATGCDTRRSEGDLDARLVNLNRENGAVFLAVELVGENESLAMSYSLDELRTDSVSVPNLKSGRYTVRAQTLDEEGREVQAGLSPLIEVVEGEISPATVAMVSLDFSVPCVAEEKVCEVLPGVDVVMGCDEDAVRRPVENCGDAMQCTEGACVEGSPHEAPDQGDPEEAVSTEVSISVCDPSIPGNRFTTEITNPYFPVVVGSRRVFEGEDDEEENMRLEIVVPEEDPILVDGVAVRAVDELESEDGVLRQRARNYYAQAEDGTVCYFGEEVRLVDDGDEILIGEVSWVSDTAARIFPGIAMPAAPGYGMTFQQAVAPGVSLDRGEIVGVGATLPTEIGDYNDTIWILETSPLDRSGDGSIKVYARDVGLVADEGLRSVEI